ncbi:MAG: Uma2 family endonuclease [Chloroflexi bacterium]|nr:Uma2 family endonuclease [Chloroflexota bacterium]
MASATPPRVKTRITYEEYRALPENGNRLQVVNGELIMTAAPFIGHQRVSGNLQFILESHVRANKWGRVLAAPVEVYLSEDNFLQPDLVCVSHARHEIITEKNIVGAPDLIVEILSPSTARTDRVTKAKIYARYRVLHYWIVDPVALTLEAFEWADGAYRLVAAVAEDETFQPALFPGLTIALTEVWQ